MKTLLKQKLKSYLAIALFATSLPVMSIAQDDDGGVGGGGTTYNCNYTGSFLDTCFTPEATIYKCRNSQFGVCSYS